MERKQLISHLQGEKEQSIGRMMVDAAELTWKTNRPQTTDFYDPFERKVARSVLSAIPEVNVVIFGGYRQAERARLVVVPQFYLNEAIESPIRVIQAKGNFNYISVTHRDFLGSLMNLGLKRGKIGDLLCLSDGCQVIVATEIIEYILHHWNRVHQVSLQVTEIDPQQLAIEPQKTKEIKSTVASMRLDAVAASGYGMSRTKMVREIKSKKLKVNWEIVDNPAYEVNEGDVLSMTGRGRVIIDKVTGLTKKGRVGLILKRLI